MTKLGKTLIKANDKSKLLQSCPICAKLEDDSLLEISKISTVRNFKKGEFLMVEGDSSNGFYLMLSGKVRVYKSSSCGKEKVLLIAERGMTFGEDALFGEGSFLEMAVALEETQALLIPRKEFLDMLLKNQDLSFQVMESLCMWIRRLSSSVENVAFLSAKDKVAQYLIELSQKKNSLCLALPAKKKEIADQLGLAPETFSRALHDFSEQQIVKIDKREIMILSLEQLHEVINP